MMKRAHKFFAMIAVCLFALVVMVGCGRSVETQSSSLADETNAEEGAELSVEMETVSEPETMAEAETITEPETMAEAETITEPETTMVQADEEEEKTITISLAGDCSLGKLSVHGYEGTFYEMYDLHGADYFFKNVKNIFEADDLTLVNFEGVLTDSDELVEKQYNIKGEPEYNQILTEGSVEAVSFGNNHRIDYGQEGVDDTIAAFNEVGVRYAYDDITGIYETENGVKVGFVSVNEVYDEKQVEVYLEDGINQLKEEADVILTCCHWGDETHHYPNDYQIELGRKCIDWGADLVVGCHPHVLEGIDCYNGKYILYSLGNFCFGGNRNPKDKNTMIVQAKVTLDTQGQVGDIGLHVIPCTISSVSERNDYCPTVAEGDKREKILGLLRKYSKNFNVEIAEDGSVIQK